MQVDTSEAAFRAWLTKNAHENVGRRGQPGDCAYARYLMDNGANRASVGATEYETLQLTREGRIHSRRHTPSWLQGFIAQFDRGGPHHNVTGAEALSYLGPEHVQRRSVPQAYEPKQGHVEALPWGGHLQPSGKVAWKNAPVYGGGGFDPGRPEFKHHYEPCYV